MLAIKVPEVAADELVPNEEVLLVPPDKEEDVIALEPKNSLFRNS